MGHLDTSGQAGDRRGAPRPRARLLSTATFMWIVAVALLLIWIGVFFVWRVPGGFMHVFLVAAIGTALMNLVAHYWSHE